MRNYQFDVIPSQVQYFYSNWSEFHLTASERKLIENYEKW